MAIQFLRGNTAANNQYTGPDGSFTVDTEEKAIRLHDGATQGGFVVARIGDDGSIQSISGSGPISIGGTVTDPVIEIREATESQSGIMSASDKYKLDRIEAGAQKNVGDEFSSNGNYPNLRARGTKAADVGLGNVDNTSDANKPISTAQQSALDAKAPINNPTFTGTVTIDEGVL